MARDVFAAPHDSRADAGADGVCCHLQQCRGFLEYYQVNRRHEDDEAEEPEPRGTGELTSRALGLNSPWGTIWSIQEKTGWTHRYVLWEESWLNIQMKLMDAPRVVTAKRKKAIENDDDLIEFLKINQ